MSIHEKIYSRRWDSSELQEVRGVWDVLARHFFQALIGENKIVVDVGCGFCHFLNGIRALEKWGVDANQAAASYAGEDVHLTITDDLSLPDLPESYFDCVFISNFLEHLNSSSDVVFLLQHVRELLKPGGTVIILQPNFRLLGAAYFDFIDHKTILTERSVSEALEIAGLEVRRKITRFLPYTTKSRFPRHPLLVRLYLACRPLWIFAGKQSLFVAEKPDASPRATTP